MKNQKATSLIDVPRSKEFEELFGVEPYQKGLIQFIEHAETPIAIALQGEVAGEWIMGRIRTS